MLPTTLLAGFPRPNQDNTRKDPLPECLFSLQWNCADGAKATLTIDEKSYGLFYFLRIFDRKGAMIRATPKVVTKTDDETPLLNVLEKYL